MGLNWLKSSSKYKGGGGGGGESPVPGLSHKAVFAQTTNLYTHTLAYVQHMYTNKCTHKENSFSVFYKYMYIMEYEHKQNNCF